MGAVQALMDTGALRMSDDHTATIRAFLGALNEQWLLLYDPQDVTLAVLRWELGLAAAPPEEKPSLGAFDTGAAPLGQHGLKSYAKAQGKSTESPCLSFHDGGLTPAPGRSDTRSGLPDCTVRPRA